MTDSSQNEKREISEFSLTALQIMGRLILQDNVDEDIIDSLRRLELIYDSLYRKYLIMEERVNFDEKTALLKYNEDFLVNIVKTASRYWQQQQSRHLMDISYLRLDLDDFSYINNTYGHEQGDQVLKEISATMKKVSRPTDYLFRFGGEEFDVVLPATPLEGAQVYADKLLHAIGEVKVPCQDDYIRVSASIGIDSFMVDLGESYIASQEILDRYHEAQRHADYACYNAKYSGKSRWSVYNARLDYQRIMQEYGERTRNGK